LFEPGEADGIERRGDALATLGRGDAAQQQRKLDVLLQRLPGKQLCLLRHEADFPIDGIDGGAAMTHSAARRCQQSGGHLQQRALAAAAGPDHRDEFSVSDVKVDAVDHHDARASRRCGKILPDVVEREHCVVHVEPACGSIMSRHKSFV
jgi:hypothetical protein